jgi:hemoglobin
MNTAVLDRSARTPFEMIGGVPSVRRLVDRFYDLMDAEPDYAALRALHAPDLTPMRDSLTLFLTAWLGGPRDWFTQRPGACIMSAHAKVAISRLTADQWLAAMGRAMEDAGIEAPAREMIGTAFTRMAQGMAMR